MYQVIRHKKYLKDLQKIKRGFKASTFMRIENRLAEAIECLSIDKPLDKSFDNHDLHDCKTFTGCSECHILGDLVLVYKKEGNECKLLTLMRLGNHNKILESKVYEL